MPVHKLKFLDNPATIDDPNPPPISLPVLYNDDKIALAIFEDAYYHFNLSDPVAELLISETFVLGFGYTNQLNQIQAKYKPGAVLTSIQLIFADVED